MGWIQFSIVNSAERNAFPVRALERYIPKLAEAISSRWHFLFEPSLLIRVETDGPPEEGMLDDLPPDTTWELGDAENSSPSGKNGLHDFTGEQTFYGSEELWQRNADFLHANSRLIAQLSKEGKLTFTWLRKHMHLFCNQAGMNYLREAGFLFLCSMRSLYLYFKYGRQ